MPHKPVRLWSNSDSFTGCRILENEAEKLDLQDRFLGVLSLVSFGLLSHDSYSWLCHHLPDLFSYC